MRNLVVAISLLLCVHSLSQEISINECLALNSHSITDEDGDHSDWIEVYNSGSSAIDLDGWYLSDDEDLPAKWQFGTASVEPQEHLIVFASSKDRSGPGELHTNFKISSTGEALLLSDPGGDLVSMLPAVALGEDFSFGALDDGVQQELGFFNVPTPGSSNAEGQIIAIGFDALEFTRVGGFYDEPFDLEISSTTGAEIRYTLDGSQPDSSSPIYEAGLFISAREDVSDVISLINTGNNYYLPQTNGAKANVVKAASFINGQRLSQVHTETYFVSDGGEERYSGIPVISLTVDADSLFSYERGIYVPGVNHVEDDENITGNYAMRGRDWEREVYIEYFDSSHEKGIAHEVGLRIHGGSSRAHPQKTLRVYAREEYGEERLAQQFFPEKDISEYKRILLRSASSDFGNTLLRDLYASRLVADLHLDYMAGEVCVVYINGEYWGIHAMRERVDRYYLEDNHGIDRDNVDLLSLEGRTEEGTAFAYNQLINYALSHDLSDPIVYQYIEERIDMANFIDYNIAQLFLSNTDWPSNNIRYWRERSAEGKWRWIFYDCDYCMLKPALDGLRPFVEDDASEIGFNPLLAQCMYNEQFRQRFAERFFYLLNTTFDSERMLQELEVLELQYEPLVREHIDRWNDPTSVTEWAVHIDELHGFALRRPGIALAQVLDYLGSYYSLFPNPVEASRGEVHLDIYQGDDIDIDVEIFNLMGESMYADNLAPNNDDTPASIPLTGLEPGTYLVQVQYGVILFSKKLIIQ